MPNFEKFVSKFKRRIGNKEGIFRSVSILVTGSAFSQIILLISLPLLTRLYGPDNFSTLAVYTSLLGIVSVAACLGFDMAIPMPEAKSDAINILLLATFLAFVISFGIGAVLYVLDDSYILYSKFDKLSPFLWMLPIGIFLSASFSAIQFYAVREKAFSDISKTRIAQSTITVIIQTGFGFFGGNLFGLIFGQMLNGGSGGLFLWKKLIKRPEIASFSWKKLKDLLFEYKKFPQYVTFETLINSAGIQVPVILIASLVVGPEAGFLFLAMRVMQAPMGLIGGAIGQAYLSKAPEEYRANNLALFTRNIIEGLMKTGVGPIVFAGIAAPSIFTLVFGAEWERAGILITWMVPWFIFQFLASPVSMVMHVKHAQRYMLYMTFFGFVIRIGSVLGMSQISLAHVAESYIIFSGVFYFFCLLVFSYVAGLTASDLFTSLRRSLIYIASWGALGLIVHLLVNSIFIGHSF